MKRPTVVGTGLIVLDIVFRAADRVPMQQSAGGTCGNVLAILAFLGWRAVPVARLAPDNARRVLDADLRRFNVEIKFLGLEPVAPTPIIVERFTPSTPTKSASHRFGWTCPTCGSAVPRFRPISSDTARHFLETDTEADVFFFDRASPGAVLMARAYAERGALVVFEPGSHGDASLLAAAVEAAHVVKYSHERFPTFPDLASRRAPVLEIQSLGADGLRYRRGKARWNRIAAVDVTSVQDAAGSGDWLTSAFLTAVGGGGSGAFRSLSDATISSALERAQVGAAWNCAFVGARGGMYSPEEDRGTRRRGRGPEPVAMCPSCPAAQKQRRPGRVAAAGR